MIATVREPDGKVSIYENGEMRPAAKKPWYRRRMDRLTLGMLYGISGFWIMDTFEGWGALGAVLVLALAVNFAADYVATPNDSLCNWE